MKLFSQSLVFLAAVQLAVGLGNGKHHRRASMPKNPHDANTTPYCTWWHDYDAVMSIDDLLDENMITITQFMRWNPSVSSAPAQLIVGRSYCVEAAFEPEPEPGTETTTTSTTTTSASPTPTETSNGIETPIPAQPNMVGHCDAFYLVQEGDSCATIASRHGITTSQLLAWNRNIGSNCAGLWADAHACVSIIGHEPSSTNASPTSSATSNEVATPSPLQPNVVDNCNKFYFVQTGDGCAAIASKNSITVADFVKWNPSVGSTCGGLWAEAYACVSVIGHTPTKPDNGITTPTPTQPDIVDNCDRFHLVQPGEKCSTVANANGISIPEFLEWNPKAGSGCTGLKTNAYACVSIVGHTPTKPDNGITTPTPTQPDIVDNCDKFHLVQSGEKCSTVANKNGITIPQFLEWNPKAGSGCTGLVTNAYACVSIIGHTPTKPDNGISTPTPVQPNIPDNCSKFHLVQSGQRCSTVANANGISIPDFLEWNPEAGSGCTGLKTNAHACVWTIDYKPYPTQPGINSSCKQYHFVGQGQSCQTVQTKYSVTLANLHKWNPGIGRDCSGMWAESYLCVSA